ncbi:MAG TPA: cold shock domain-containing protein [Cyclobacteriaceae bacterium]|nr:cold shock domain-containing protein [Cyclobacteriaceae bacterium]
MARPQETFNKKELQKRRAQKKKEKEERKQERKANAKSGQSLDDMMAYVDEFGNISSTPPDPLKKRSVIKVEDIVTGSRNEGGAVVSVRKGKVSFFNTAKGFGFILDSDSGERVFVHMNGLKTPIQENDMVSFETERGPKGLQAKDVKVIK